MVRTMQSLIKNSLRLATAVLLVGQVGLASAGQNIFKIYAPGMRATTVPVTAPTYATLNPNDMGATVALSANNLAMTGIDGDAVRATIGHSSGKWYFETTIGATSGVWPGSVGVMNATGALRIATPSTGYYLFCPQPGPILVYSGGYSGYGTAMSTGSTIGVAVDLDNSKITFYENGVSQGVGFSGSSFPAGTYYPAIAAASPAATSGFSVNFGATPFKYSVPAGYNAGWY